MPFWFWFGWFVVWSALFIFTVADAFYCSVRRNKQSRQARSDAESLRITYCGAGEIIILAIIAIISGVAILVPTLIFVFTHAGI